LFLGLSRKPNDLYFSHGLLSGLLSGSNDKVADGAALNLGGAAYDGKGVGRYSSLDSRRSVSSGRHINPFATNVRWLAVQSQIRAGALLSLSVQFRVGSGSFGSLDKKPV
jgi:hypothetical protein